MKTEEKVAEFNKIFNEEKKAVPNRQSMKSETVSQMALPSTIVKYLEFLETTKPKGVKRGNTKTSNDKN